ncbi:MAG: hypothetical protein ABJF04_09270 [Reichenbachiella sp.]|uniref:hypothetical protein n=1 Tax=Reichenbachiella sp. TaxID=2184521 RepID=UPI0032666B8D
MRILTIVLSLLSIQGIAQDSNISLPGEMARANYFHASDEITGMLEDRTEMSFKKAVFTVENAFFDNQLSYDKYDYEIQKLVRLAEYNLQAKELIYDLSDKDHVARHGAIYFSLMDTTKVYARDTVFLHLPFSYDFEDFMGDKDWSKMFVAKLLDTGTGNCHSLPFLYKILAEEMGETAYLSMAPNHTYIKLWTERSGWFNTELTSASFPIDAWIMASGYVHLNAVQNGIYMDTLSLKQSIAVNMLDLAKGYEKRFGKSDNPEFVLDCVNATLEHYPLYINALLLKAETMKVIYERMMEEYGASSPNDLFEYPKPKAWFDEMQALYFNIHQLGYRKMPNQMYLNWLADLNEHKEKYANKDIMSNFRTE